MADTDASPDAGDRTGLIDSIGNRTFVVAYLANLALVTANTATFIFAEWVARLASAAPEVAYQEELPGRIVQCGVAVSLVCRIFLGQAIDRFGVRRVWLVVSSLALSGVAVFTCLSEISLWLWIGRVLLATGISGMFTCSTFHIQACVAERRRTEFIALLGSSGFVGMVLGTQLAGFLERMFVNSPDGYFRWVFGSAATLLAFYVVGVVYVTRILPRQQQHETRPSLLRLTRTYWPGMITLVAMTMGVLFIVPSLYLVRFNQHEGFGGIATYWSVYALTAFSFRIGTAALSQKVGRHRLVFVGLLAQGLGLWALIPVTAWWHLLFSATLCGFGHAFLFPSIVSLGSGTFPTRYRGSGTNLTLGCLDLGIGLSAPLMGRVIDMERFDGAGFRPMFFCAGCIAIGVGVIWIATHRASTDSEVARTRPPFDRR